MTNYMIEASPKRILVFQWIVWHYARAPKQIILGWFNFLSFIPRYFSFGTLLKTLFAHWRRYKDSYGRGFDIKVYARTFLLNIISRILGAIIRIVVIAAGLIVELFVFIIGLALFVFWFAWPLFVICGIYVGLVLII